MATGSLRATGANMDLIMANKRREEIKLKVLNDYVGGQTRLTMAAEMETAVPQRRRAAQTLRLEMESRIAEEAARREAAKRRKEYEVHQGAAIAKELERRKTVQDTKEREIVRICNESEELKDLEKKLKTAYMNKERAAQHEERMLRQRRDILREKAIDDAMEADRIAAEIADQEKGGSKKNVTARQKAGLEKQMKEREYLKVEAAEQAKEDKAMVEAIVAKIEAEDRAEYEAREKHKAETRVLIKQYAEQRKRDVIEARQQAAEEEAEIIAYSRALAAREEQLEQMKKEKALAAKKAFDKIVQQTELVRSADDEIARLRDLLWEEELLKKSRILEEEREAKRLANIAEMKRQNDIVLANKKKQQAVEQAEEERLVQVMIDKFKRDDEEERLKQQAIRDAKDRYKGMISDDADAKHERYLKHLADEENLKQDDDSGEQYRLQVVREARRRLLAEHADALRGFMPKGAVSAEERDEFAL
mmetsp:Transcript_21802/g.61388  ORF Transcript_21802/g.61388 Transcript_21802/m.61388 type:complete len:478 (+) Transcript_21802:170-1603(+)